MGAAGVSFFCAHLFCCWLIIWRKRYFLPCTERLQQTAVTACLKELSRSACRWASVRSLEVLLHTLMAGLSKFRGPAVISGTPDCQGIRRHLRHGAASAGIASMRWDWCSRVCWMASSRRNRHETCAWALSSPFLYCCPCLLVLLSPSFRGGLSGSIPARAACHDPLVAPAFLAFTTS